MSTIDVRLADRSYQVVVEPGLRSQCGERLRQLVDFRPGRSVLLIADESVSETFAEDVAASIEAAGFGALEAVSALAFASRAAAAERAARRRSCGARSGVVGGDDTGKRAQRPGLWPTQMLTQNVMRQ